MLSHFDVRCAFAQLACVHQLGLRADWQEQLAKVNRDLGIVGVRFHGSFDGQLVHGEPS